MKNLMVAVFIAFTVAACASSAKKETTQVPQPETASKPAAENAAKTSTQEAPAQPPVPVATEAEKLAAQLKELKQKSVYFDFDQYDVKSIYQDVIQQQAEFMLAHKNDMVTLEGNADERGSNEYNLALGDRRAVAVSKNLKLLGVSEEQIKIVSYGEEKPRLTCHEESCWKENRRVDFVHQLNSQ